METVRDDGRRGRAVGGLRPARRRRSPRGGASRRPARRPRRRRRSRRPRSSAVTGRPRVRADQSTVTGTSARPGRVERPALTSRDSTRWPAASTASAVAGVQRFHGGVNTGSIVAGQHVLEPRPPGATSAVCAATDRRRAELALATGRLVVDVGVAVLVHVHQAAGDAGRRALGRTTGSRPSGSPPRRRRRRRPRTRRAAPTARRRPSRRRRRGRTRARHGALVERRRARGRASRSLASPPSAARRRGRRRSRPSARGRRGRGGTGGGGAGDAADDLVDEAVRRSARRSATVRSTPEPAIRAARRVCSSSPGAGERHDDRRTPGPQHVHRRVVARLADRRPPSAAISPHRSSTRSTTVDALASRCGVQPAAGGGGQERPGDERRRQPGAGEQRRARRRRRPCSSASPTIPPPADTSSRAAGACADGAGRAAGTTKPVWWTGTVERRAPAGTTPRSGRTPGRCARGRRRGTRWRARPPARRGGLPSSRPTRMSRTLDTTSGSRRRAAAASSSGTQLELELAPAERVQLDDDHVGRERGRNVSSTSRARASLDARSTERPGSWLTSRCSASWPSDGRSTSSTPCRDDGAGRQPAAVEQRHVERARPARRRAPASARGGRGRASAGSGRAGGASRRPPARSRAGGARGRRRGRRARRDGPG